MAITNLSTVHQILGDGAKWKPIIAKVTETSTLGPASQSLNGPIHETHRYSVARVSWYVGSINANTTILLNMRTGDIPTMPETVLSSSGAAAVSITTTGAGWATFHGLNRYSQVQLACSTAAGHGSTDFRCIVEFVDPHPPTRY